MFHVSTLISIKSFEFRNVKWVKSDKKKKKFTTEGTIQGQEAEIWESDKKKKVF